MVECQFLAIGLLTQSKLENFVWWFYLRSKSRRAVKHVDQKVVAIYSDQQLRIGYDFLRFERKNKEKKRKKTTRGWTNGSVITEPCTSYRMRSTIWIGIVERSWQSVLANVNWDYEASFTRASTAQCVYTRVQLMAKRNKYQTGQLNWNSILIRSVNHSIESYRCRNRWALKIVSWGNKQLESGIVGWRHGRCRFVSVEISW